MMKGMSPEKRTQMMLSAPVSRVIPRLAIPTIIYITKEAPNYSTNQ